MALVQQAPDTSYCVTTVNMTDGVTKELVFVRRIESVGASPFSSEIAARAGRTTAAHTAHSRSSSLHDLRAEAVSRARSVGDTYEECNKKSHETRK